MALAVRTAQTSPEGPLASGNGLIGMGRTVGELPVTWASRTERADGKTSPEELCPVSRLIAGGTITVDAMLGALPGLGLGTVIAT